MEKGPGDILYVEVETDSARSLESVDLGFEGLELGGVSSCESLVRLGAGVGGRSAGHFPLVWPVACDNM